MRPPFNKRASLSEDSNARAPFPACGSCDEVASRAGRPPVNLNRKLRRRRRALGARDGESVPVTPVDEALEELILVSGFSNDVSMVLTGSATDRARELASMVHAKACAHGRSIGFVCRSNMFDHSAILGLARMIIECLSTYAYLIEQVTEEDWAFRYAVLRLHDTVSRIKLLRAWPAFAATADLKAGRDDLIMEIRSHPAFAGFDGEQQKRLVSGETIFIGGMRKSAALAGWNPDVFTALYGYFSAHLHAAPMSFFRMDDHRVDYFYPNDAQKQIASAGIATAAAALRRLSLLHLGDLDYSGHPTLSAVTAGMREADAACEVFG